MPKEHRKQVIAKRKQPASSLLSLFVVAALVCLLAPAFCQSQGIAVHLKAGNGQYVVAEGGGGGIVNANRPQAGPWETFTLIDKNGSPLVNGDAVNFKTATGHFLVAEGSGGREVLANRTAAGPWETFLITKVRGSAGQEIVHGDAIALRASNGQYVVAEGGGGGVVNANRNAIGAWETFTLEVVGGAAPPPPPPPPTVGVAPTRPLGPLAPGGRLPTKPAGPAPTNLKATAPGPTSVSLGWNAPAGTTTPVIGYQVYREGNPVGGQLASTTTSFTDTGLNPRTAYRYTVAALYGPQAPVGPGMSAPVSVLTALPLPPADLKATLTGPNTAVVTWSVRREAVGYILSRNGTRIRVASTGYTDQGLTPDSYSYSVAAIYRVEGLGEQVGIFSSPVTLAPRPFNMVVVGDSLMWGQGLSASSKFSTKVKQWLESRLQGRPVNMYVLAHSGAVIGFAASPGDELTNELNGARGEIPNDFPTIAFQAKELVKNKAGLRREDVDLVLMDGCINDVNVKRIISPDPSVGPDWVRKWARIKCSDSMNGLLSLAMDDQWFPNAKIVVTGYFPIISFASGLPEVTALLSTYGLIGQGILGAAPDPLATLVTAGTVTAVGRGKLAAQSAAFHDESTKNLRDVVDDINQRYGTNRWRFASVPFRPENSYGGSQSWLYRAGEKDEAWDERQRVCAPGSAVASVATLGKCASICSCASMGHPNPAGAQAYANAITSELQAFVPEWQAQWGPRATVSSPPSPPLYVLAEYASRTPAGVTMTVFAADWATGAGVQGSVRLDRMDKGPIGTPITFALNPQPANQRRNPTYGGLTPPMGSVSVIGYPEVSFPVRPPVLKLKVAVVPGDPPGPTEQEPGTMTVNAVDTATGQPVRGTVLVNGEVVGQTGATVSYSCPQPDVQQPPEVEMTPAGKPRVSSIPRQARALRCSGVVQATGYADARFTL